MLRNFCAHLVIQIHEPKKDLQQLLNISCININFKTLQEVVISSLERDEKTILQCHTESRFTLYAPGQGKQALTPATTYPVSWSQLFLQQRFSNMIRWNLC